MGWVWLDRYPLLYQDLFEWCWIAVAASVSGYYASVQDPEGIAAPPSMSQEEVAEQLISQNAMPGVQPGDCNNAAALPEACDQAGSLNEALKAANHYCISGPAAATSQDRYADVSREIGAGRPLGVHIEWNATDSFHYAAIAGYCDDENGWLLVEDPYYGESMQQKDVFPDSYPPGYGGSGGAWIDSHYTRFASQQRDPQHACGPP